MGLEEAGHNAGLSSLPSIQPWAMISVMQDWQCTKPTRWIRLTSGLDVSNHPGWYQMTPP